MAHVRTTQGVMSGRRDGVGIADPGDRARAPEFDGLFPATRTGRSGRISCIGSPTPIPPSAHNSLSLPHIRHRLSVRGLVRFDGVATPQAARQYRTRVV